ncbi:alcohol dehydrogenase catalytic domain-containing protein [Streptomyces enissocaesilis]|uniref:alcohol dehydrogenase catalytic domain-containing protein n=1 Tax=Streptomyces enissocaesilis TaxID=332589 RepID=UPI0031DDF3A2
MTGFGGFDKLEFRADLPDPRPGPGEVVVRVAAAGLNNTDIWTREGAYGNDGDADALAGWSGEPLDFPRIQGADVAGYIEETGFGVPETRVGERVLVDPMLYTGGERELVTPRYLGSEADGGYAEFVAVPAANAHPVGSPLGDAELATFPTAYLTALRMLRRARVTEGETVLVTGASGGVGSALVQLCATRGARVVAVTTAEKADAVARVGAHRVLTREHFDPAGVAEEIDVVADVVGGRLFGELLGEVVRPLGRYVTAGAIAGPVVEVDLRRLYLKQVELIGSSFGSHEDFTELVALIQGGALRALLARTYPLADLVSAQKEFMAKNFVGNIVVTP